MDGLHVVQTIFAVFSPMDLGVVVGDVFNICRDHVIEMPYCGHHNQYRFLDQLRSGDRGTDRLDRTYFNLLST